MTRTLFTCLVALLAFSAGCAEVDYQGEVYPETEAPLVVDSLSSLPGDYMPIGRAVASVPAGYGGDSLVEALQEQAAEVGAHAVVVGEYRKVLVGKHLHWRYEPYSGSYDRAYDTGLLGSWSGLSFDPGWNAPMVHYDFDLELKAVFLRRAPTSTSQSPAATDPASTK
ncbi:MAG: hypothetical protein R3F62_29565 [Planctomycetota bacterium]